MVRYLPLLSSPSFLSSRFFLHSLMQFEEIDPDRPTFGTRARRLIQGKDQRFFQRAKSFGLKMQKTELLHLAFVEKSFANVGNMPRYYNLRALMVCMYNVYNLNTNTIRDLLFTSFGLLPQQTSAWLEVCGDQGRSLRGPNAPHRVLYSAVAAKRTWTSKSSQEFLCGTASSPDFRHAKHLLLCFLFSSKDICKETRVFVPYRLALTTGYTDYQLSNTQQFARLLPAMTYPSQALPTRRVP
ncbi:hypothetical protein B0J12DRAFT_703839 [Macrophomina phaseolina]|uniref:Uncharacterized protein n=1 Tax=Macrophomina phaseolina TaxID=35725 RepID=A0ABQ8FX87_9PEZI|nr:hypothetical protein B0J12DRAFT_703839 [Macrophomina phaseolina]